MSTDNIVFSIEGEVAYTDGTKAGFGAAIDDSGNIESEGLGTAFADILAIIKGLFTALSGTLTMSVAGTSKTVKSSNVRMEALGTVSGAKSFFFSENTETTGALISSGGATAYATIKANFKTQIQNTINALTGVTVTIA